MSLPAQQPWVCNLTIMQQSVLFAAIRAPDGIRKDHPVKVLMRWYRRCVLICAFEGRAIENPFDPGGGSFTGPFTAEHASEFRFTNDAPFTEVAAWWGTASEAERQQCFDGMRNVYLRYVDELPHHFQLHLMHAAEIVGYEHPDPNISAWWRGFYMLIVNDAHLFPESQEQMRDRLSDGEEAWRRREVVTAQ